MDATHVKTCHACRVLSHLLRTPASYSASTAILVGSVSDVGITKKSYRRRCEDQIGMCIQDTFAPLLQSCSSLAAAGADTNRKTNEILAQVTHRNFMFEIWTPFFTKYRGATVLCRIPLSAVDNRS